MSQIKINSSQVAHIIDLCLEGVAKSKVGDIYLRDPQGSILRDAMGSPLCQTVGLSTFLTILSCYFPKNFNMEHTSDVG